MGTNNNNNNNNYNYKPTATKISEEADELLGRLALRKGLSKYDILQMTVDIFIRYMDDRHNLTPEMERAMAVFEHLEGWSEAFNLADPIVRKEIGEAIYFLQDPEGKRKGVRAAHVRKPFFEDRDITYNLRDIFERAINLLAPDRYMRLRRLAAVWDCEGILELLDYLIDVHSEDADTEELRKTFEDCNRHDYGKRYEYGHKMRGIHKRDIEKVGGLFDNENQNENDFNENENK